MLRRSGFLAAGAALAALPRAVGAQTLPTVRVGGTTDASIVGTLWGMQSGLFARYGVDVGLTSMSSGAAVSAALLGGSLDIGKSSLFGIIVGHAKGVPFALVAPSALYTAEGADTMLLVAKDGPIHSARDLNGKTVSVPALGDVFTIGNLEWIDQNGGDSRSVHLLELPHRAAAEALAAGRVDAATLAEPLLGDALASGKYRVLAHPLDAISKRFIVTAYVATLDYVTKNADTVARFRRGIVEANAYAQAHETEMLPIIAKFSGIDPKTIQNNPTTLGTLANLEDPHMIQPLIDAAVKYKAIPKPFPARELLDPTLVS
jgi:NitT/TauT family transport system substrate-binding protein